MELMKRSEVDQEAWVRMDKLTLGFIAEDRVVLSFGMV